MKTRIRSFIMAMLLVLSMTATSMAAGAVAPVSFNLRAACVSGSAIVDVYLNAQHASNGRFVINYDPKLVELAEVRTDGAWVTSVNNATEGQIAFAWVGSDISGFNCVLELIFNVKVDHYTSTTFSGKVTELYSNGNSLLVGEVPADSVELVISSTPQPGPSNPTNPNPNPPVDPDDGKDDDVKPGINITVPELTSAKYQSILAQYPDAKGHWAEESIVKAINAGLFNGTSANTFTPDGDVTRGMFATLLYRLSGSPAVGSKMPFSDVSSSQYYYDAIIWAYSNGIVTGLSDTQFAPDAKVSREQMVTMLYRYAKYINDDTSATTSLNSFGDRASVSSWAMDAMRWAVAEGLINGSNGNLNPAANSTRAQIATVLVRYVGL